VLIPGWICARWGFHAPGRQCVCYCGQRWRMFAVGCGCRIFFPLLMFFPLLIWGRLVTSSTFRVCCYSEIEGTVGWVCCARGHTYWYFVADLKRFACGRDGHIFSLGFCFALGNGIHSPHTQNPVLLARFFSFQSHALVQGRYAVKRTKPGCSATKIAACYLSYSIDFSFIGLYM
jgi:hypothetical protein